MKFPPFAHYSAAMESTIVNGLDSPDADHDSQTSSVGQKSNILAAKVTSILSASYANSEIGDVLQIIDTPNTRFAPSDRRHLRIEVNKDIIDCNATIIDDFGHVAEVC